MIDGIAFQTDILALNAAVEAVTHLDLMTQQNAAVVEESAAAASSLRDQAARLVEVVSVVRLAEAHRQRSDSLAA